MDRELIPIVFSTDHNFVMPTGVTLHSLLTSSGGEKYDIHIMVGDDVSLEDKENLQQEVRINSKDSRLTFIDVGKMFDDGHIERHFSKATYARLAIPWLLPQFDKIIYADVDLIFNIGLKRLYDDTNLEDKYLAGVVYPRKKDGAMNNYIESLGLAPDSYINAGFIIINSKLQREDNLFEKYKPLISKNHRYVDQDVINTVCKNKIAFLPQRYNIKAENITAQDLTGEYVIHYTDKKPWDTFKNCWIEWWDNYRDSTFYNPAYYLEVTAKIIEDLNNGYIARETLESKKLKMLLQLSEKIKNLKRMIGIKK